LLPCSEAGDAGEATEVDDHIIDHGEQHATCDLEHLERCQCCHWACAGSFKMHLTII